MVNAKLDLNPISSLCEFGGHHNTRISNKQIDGQLFFPECLDKLVNRSERAQIQVDKLECIFEAGGAF